MFKMCQGEVHKEIDFPLWGALTEMERELEQIPTAGFQFSFL